MCPYEGSSFPSVQGEEARNEHCGGGTEIVEQFGKFLGLVPCDRNDQLGRHVVGNHLVDGPDAKTCHIHMFHKRKQDRHACMQGKAYLRRLDSSASSRLCAIHRFGCENPA